MKNAKRNSLAIILLLIMLPILGNLDTWNLPISAMLPEERLYVINPDAIGELNIYTHESFLAWGPSADYEAVMDQAFHSFGLEHNVTVNLHIFSGMVEALNILIQNKDDQLADIVIGLDSTMVSRAKSENILLPYTEVNLENISTDLVNALDADKYLIPIDYGLLAFVYDSEFINSTQYSELDALTFDNLLNVFGEDLAVQNPTLSATGLNFLLYQIVFYEEILGLDWQDWWKEAKDLVAIDDSWSDSWDRVFGTKQKHIMVSYGTDPGYNAFFGYGNDSNARIIEYESDLYGWMQIEGIGIVNGATNLTLAKAFIDHAISNDFQELIATNNWMFPASSSVDLPPCYDYAITTENVTILNALVTPSYIGENYQAWLVEWQNIIYVKKYWWVWIIVSSVIIIGITVTVVIYIRKTKLKIEE
ncbi:MAG: thiamine ABC transporter substrate-binding protein [Candidatus Heimdallarchaeota archaeon]